MANWSLPTIADLYDNVLTFLKDRDLDLAKALDPAYVTSTNVAAGFMRFNSASKKWETFNGSAWVDSSSEYAINVLSATKWKTSRTLGVTGDVTGTSAAFDGSANATLALTLANSGVTAATYGAQASRSVPVVTIDSKGRVTSASSYALGTMADQSANNVSVSGGAIGGVDLTIKYSTTAAPTATGRVEWDSDHFTLKVGTGSATKTFSADDKLATLYEPKFTKNTAFNKNFGSSAGEVAEGNHDHFPAGTIMLFGQSAAPTGWTKLTDHDNKALRVVSGTVGTGGTYDFTTAFSNSRQTNGIELTATSGGTTLSTAQMPSHTHNVLTQYSGGTYVAGHVPEGGYTINSGVANGYGIQAAGSSGSHSHSITIASHAHVLSMAVAYVDVIRAQKN